MSDFDTRLRTLLEAEAEGVRADASRGRATITDVRRRLLVRTAGAVAAACMGLATAVVGGDAALSALDRDGRGSPAAAGGPSPAYVGAAGDYPVIAEGTFGGRRWTLSVVEDPDAAHPEDTESENPEILFEFEGPAGGGGSFETYSGWDVLAEPFLTSLDEDGYELVMGMVSDSVASVTVESDDGTSLDVPVYEGGDRPLADTDYYMALLESDGMGRIVARDEDGEVLAGHPLVENPGTDLSSVECFGPGEAPPIEEEERDPAAGYRDVGQGTFDGRRWTLEMIEHPDIAHPEDTESENPEILFEIEGPEPNSAAFETHGSWDTIEAPWRHRIEGTDFAMGMAATNVAFVAFEGDDGTTVEGSLFEGAGLPGPEANYWVVFMPHGAQGDVVARDASGAVVGRAAVDDGWAQEIDFDC